MAEFGPPTPLTEDDLIDLLNRNFEAHWIVGLLEDPSSLSIFDGNIAAILRIQTAIDTNIFNGCYILTASGPYKSTSIVRLTRPSGAAGVIPTSAQFVDNRGGLWNPTEEFTVSMSGGSQTINVPIQTQRVGYYLNSYEPLEYQIVGELFDTTFVPETGPDPAEDGASPFLDTIAQEYDQLRGPGETDQEFANRIRFLVDKVSPNAIVATVIEVLDSQVAYNWIVDLIVRYGLATVREPFQDTSQFSTPGLQGISPAYLEDNIYFDDPSGPYLRELSDGLAWFDVVFPTPVDPDDAREFYDDESPDHGSFFDDPELGYPDVTASDSLTLPISTLADELDKRRAGGVKFRIIVGETQRLIRPAANGDLDQAGDWVDQDGSDTDEDLVAALLNFDGDETYAVSAVGEADGTTVESGDLVFEIEEIPEPVSVSSIVVRARARKVDAGGVDPQLLFIFQPATEGSGERILWSESPWVIDHEYWLEYVLIMDENPFTAAAWDPADVTGTMGFGLANAAAVGATDPLWVSELRLEINASYG